MIYRKINDVEFDHVFSILSGGTVTDGPSGIHAPDSHDGELSGEGWEYLDGYSGQYGYSGPIMHPSEFIGGGMERDMLSTPGIYAVVADYASPDAPEVPEDYPVQPVPYSDGPGMATCGECGLTWNDTVSTSLTPVPSGRCPFEHFHSDSDGAEGWAVVRYTGNLPNRARYLGTWHGGHSYSHGEWTDAEWFDSLADAATCLRDRERGRNARFRYAVRADVRTDTPSAHSEGSGGIFLYRITEPITADDVESIVTGYPDRLIEFGPRGGIRNSLT